MTAAPRTSRLAEGEQCFVVSTLMASSRTLAARRIMDASMPGAERRFVRRFNGASQQDCAERRASMLLARNAAGPQQRRVGRRHATMVDSTPTGSAPASTIRSMRPPRSPSTCSGVVGADLPG